jgi:hypothetical protein
MPGSGVASAAHVSGAGVAQVVRPAGQGTATEPPAGPQVGSNADGVRIAGQILKNATSARWPMYVRNVKQLLRAYRGDGNVAANGGGAAVGPGGFDERQYGFGGLMDLLRACQKDGLLRVERDRRGGLRVFPGQALQRTDMPQVQTSREPAELQAVTTDPTEQIETETDHELSERIPVDTTAELLGRANAKPRRPRAPSSRVGASVPRGTRKAAAPRKPAARRAPRAAKVPRTDAADEGNE